MSLTTKAKDNQSKRDWLTMTKADKKELVKQIKECLQQRATEVKLSRLAHLEDNASLDIDTCKPETPSRPWYLER